MTRKKPDIKDLFKMIQMISGGLASSIRNEEIPRFAKAPHDYLNRLHANCVAELCSEWSEETKERFLNTLPEIIEAMEEFEQDEKGYEQTAKLAMLSIHAPRSVGYLISRFCMLADVIDNVVEGILNMETGEMLDAFDYLKWRFVHGLKMVYELAKIYDGNQDKATLFLDLAHIKVSEDGYNYRED
jgi:hypothetical protein